MDIALILPILDIDIDIDVGLWEALRDCRRELADEQNIPPYVIFHDSTLQEMCHMLPQNIDQFSLLTGVGERKLQKYGPIFLRTIQDHSIELASKESE